MSESIGMMRVCNVGATTSLLPSLDNKDCDRLSFPEKQLLFGNGKKDEIMEGVSSLVISTTRRSKVARCLFGRPDPGSTTKWLKDRLNEIKAQQTEQYQFDFDKCLPLHPVDHCCSASSTALGTAATTPGSGQYQFVPVNAQSVPAFYREKTVRSVDRPRRRGDNLVSAWMPDSPPPVVHDARLPDSSTPDRLANTKASKSGHIESVGGVSTPSNARKQTKITGFMPCKRRLERLCSPTEKSVKRPRKLSSRTTMANVCKRPRLMRSTTSRK